MYRGYDLRYNRMLVPPHGVVVFDVALSVHYSNSNGTVDVDFASGDFDVLSPAVLVGVLT